MRRLLTLTALLGLSLSGLLTAGPAAAAPAITADLTSATLVARGAAVDVTATVVCPVGTFDFLSLTLTQRSGSAVAAGGGSVPIGCTGEPQTVTLRAPAQAGGPPFRNGVALATGELYACNDESCAFVTINETIRITH
ncbi:hypothetical protein [Jidongwangia harbinensis]|uniref:hypothetical protein n=1 Tax=Jidongwangia harbinensis TaxID=2878561 RepID=UPI001CD92CD7|nr:hypothetical protein [Jidongwangia harbinensis]MCA2212016.1 hypothetical protein [Jidongwangia harbinensis]